MTAAQNRKLIWGGTVCFGLIAAAVLLGTAPRTSSETGDGLPRSSSPSPFGRGVADSDAGIVKIRAAKDGIVTKVLVAEGTHVEKGTALFQEDDREARATIAVIKAEIAQKDAETHSLEVKLATARKAKARLLPVVQAKAEPQRFLDEAQATVDDLEAQIATSKAARDVVRAQLDKAMVDLEACVVRAPASGTVVRQFVNAGTFASATSGEPLLWFAGDAPLIVRAEFTEDFATAISVGQAVEVIPAEGQGPHLHGKIDRIAPAFSPRRASIYDPKDRVDVRVLEAVISIVTENPKLILGQRVIVRVLG